MALTFIEWKNVNQCRPTIMPTNIIYISFLKDSFAIDFIKNPTSNNDTKAIPVLKNTILEEDRVISSPNIPVKPQTRTIMCSINWYLTVLFDIKNPAP